MKSTTDREARIVPRLIGIAFIFAVLALVDMLAFTSVGEQTSRLAAMSTGNLCLALALTVGAQVRGRLTGRRRIVLLISWIATGVALIVLMGLSVLLAVSLNAAFQYRAARFATYVLSAWAIVDTMSHARNGPGRVLRAEWYRLVHSRAVLGGAAFLVVVSVLRVYATRMSELAAYATEVQRALSRGTAAPAAVPVGNAWAPFADGWLAGLTVATLLLLILSARSLAGDREAGLLRVARTRSVSRVGLVVGRALLGLLLVVAAMALTGAASLAAATLWFDFGPIQEGSYVLASMPELRLELLRAVTATLPPLLATWCFGLAVSSFARGGTSAVSSALAVYLGFDLFKAVLGDKQYLVFAAFNPSFVDHSCLKEFAGIARGFSDAGYRAPLYAQNLWLPWPQAALLLVLAGWVISRRAL